MNKILLVEDNELIVKGLKYALKQNNYDVTTSFNYHDALDLIKQNIYDLVILDLTLPDGNGYNLGTYLKEKTKTPFIFLTARDDEENIIKGLDISEDYLTKPFHMQELLTRIKKILERVSKQNIMQINNIKIDLDKCLVTIDNEEITLTSLEYRLLKLLVLNKNKVVTREVILDKIWDINGLYVNDNTLSVYIKRLRAKLHNTNLIKTIKGIGYRIDEK